MQGGVKRRRRSATLAWGLVAAVLVLVAVAAVMGNRIMCHINYPMALDGVLRGARCEVPLDVASTDFNSNGVPNALDMVAGARLEVSGRTRYDGSYYSGGYPPDGRGACTDVVWRAFRAAGYDLKGFIDDDILESVASYPRVAGQPDPNIDFRRVPNLVAFFARHGRALAADVKPGDVATLVNWQPGDIVVFAKPQEHVGVISDCRRADGVPLVIHNAGPWASESDILLRWPTAITHHFRFP